MPKASRPKSRRPKSRRPKTRKAKTREQRPEGDDLRVHLEWLLYKNPPLASALRDLKLKLTPSGVLYYDPADTDPKFQLPRAPYGRICDPRLGLDPDNPPISGLVVPQDRK